VWRTIKSETRAEQTLNKSRFIARFTPVADAAAVSADLQEARRLWPGARHYVYAWRLRAGAREKCSDDGEPQGTGGRPLLTLLQRADLWDVLAVVARYFGGVLLGAGGLTRAYGGAARLALEQAEIVIPRRYVRYTLTLPYALYEKARHFLAGLDTVREAEEFAAEITITFLLPAEKETAWVKQAAEWGGLARAERNGELLRK
jgi:uncharacterized YigZ family protein